MSAGQGLRAVLNSYGAVPHVITTRGEFDSIDVILREYAQRGRIALSFVEAASGRPSIAARYVDDDTLVGSLWRTLTAPPLAAVVVFGEPHRAQGRGRRAWAAALRETVLQLRG